MNTVESLSEGADVEDVTRYVAADDTAVCVAICFSDGLGASVLSITYTNCCWSTFGPFPSRSFSV